MSFLADQTFEKIPVSGVYDSSNALIKIAGLALLRVESMRAVISNNVSRYPEVGSREQIPFRGHDRITCTINRAYVNGAEWRLAIGQTPDVIKPGMTGMVNGGADLGNERDISSILDVKDVTTEEVNTYPIKTRIEMEINKNKVYRRILGSGDDDYAGAKLWLVLSGVIIDTVGLNFNNRGLITSGPIVAEGETALFKIEKFLGEVAAEAGT
jgi:hypothetical protein